MNNLKHHFKIWSLFFLMGAALVGQTGTVSAAEIKAYFFYGEGCPHCAKEEAFLSGPLTDRYPELKIQSYEVYSHPDNVRLLEAVATTLDQPAAGVPYLVVGDKVFVGFSPEITGPAIEAQVAKCQTSGCPDPVAALIKSNPPTQQDQNDSTQDKASTTGTEISLPFFGIVRTADFSLPLLAITMGMLDGFNPCAMWVLLFLISLLLGVVDRRRMWLLGSTFIAASATVYFLFMAAWLQLILFLGFVAWIRIGIGLLALGGGWYSLKSFLTNPNNTCEVTKGAREQKIFDRLKATVQKESLWLALGGIIVLAFAVNLVELICSAGLPAVFTQVLALNELAAWQYYAYILLYILFFMLDDLMVFLAAMTALRWTGITTKYARFSRLIGGTIMFLIGLLLIFKPEWLMF